MKNFSVLLSILASVIFLVTATLLYPGGNFLNETSPGFDWSKNFFSNLFSEMAINGAPNIGRIWAIIGMVFNSVGYYLFFTHTAQKIPNKHAKLVLKSVGIINTIFTFLIATPLHDSMVIISSTLTLLGLFYITLFILRTKLHGLKFLCIGCMLTAYFTLYLYGVGNWGWLAVMQKVTFVYFMVFVLTLEYFTKAEDYLDFKRKDAR